MGDDGSNDRDFYEHTTFLASATVYGWRDLIVTPGSGVALLLSVPLVWLVADGCITDEELEPVALSFGAIAAAFFGITLAGLAVLATFFDPKYARALTGHDDEELHKSLFAFWWVGMLAVLALVTSIALLVTSKVTTCSAILAVATGLASVTFLAAIFEALALIGSVVRHGLYRDKINETST